MTLTPKEFVSKWKRVTVREKQICQEHFIDLCHLVGHSTPAEDDSSGKCPSFEMSAAKTSGGKGLSLKTKFAILIFISILLATCTLETPTQESEVVKDVVTEAPRAEEPMKQELAVTEAPVPAETLMVAPTTHPLQPLSVSGGGVITFASDRSGRPGIYVMNADGSGQRLVTDMEDSSFPAFSPDSARIVYKIAAPYMGKINIINIDGSDQQTVLARNRAMASPDWSPDGKEIVFIFHTHQYFSISVIDIGGGNFRQLTRAVTNQINTSPDWSPDGQQIVFSSNRNGDNEIYIMDADGSNIQQVTDNDVTDYFPAWSPDGLQIAFASGRNGNWDIYVMDVHGNNVRRLTDNPAKDWEPAWSPDGTKIAFTSDRDGNWEIYTMNADGSQPQRLTNNEAEDIDPAWRP